MENVISRKKEIISEINSFGVTVDFRDSLARMQVIDDEFKNAGYTSKEYSYLFSDFIATKRAFFERFNNYRSSIEIKKRNLINEISYLEYSKE